jgi:transcriptional regulator with XRE-family HTH domain
MAQPPARSLAERIDHLFKTVHPRDRGEYSPREVAAAIRRQGGPPISAAYIWELRTGRATDPRKSHLEALAAFFGVPVTYFLDDEQAARIAAELDLLAALRDSPARQIALRAAGLSPEVLAPIAEMLRQARRLEGLPADDPSLGSGSDPPEPAL